MTFRSRHVPAFVLQGLGLTAAVAVRRVRQAAARALTAQCGPNPIVCENTQTGNPSSEWDIAGAGDSTIQGFATDISANKGDTVHFKVTTTAAHFNIDIYRLGYYNGMGARKIASVTNITGKSQAACLVDAVTHLVDCGNWSEFGDLGGPGHRRLRHLHRQAGRGPTPAAPATSRSSFATMRASPICCFRPRTPPGRPTTSTADSASTRETRHRRVKVSYNRPFATRGQSTGFGTSDWLFYTEYPMVRWLEANGYNVSYSSGVDTDRRGTLIKNHKVFLSVGHDEYWSSQQRANVEAARGGRASIWRSSAVTKSFWKTRWEASIDGTATAYRTLVSYKETHVNAKTDPLDPPTWTGTWRDPRFSPPADGRPENCAERPDDLRQSRLRGDHRSVGVLEDALLAEHGRGAARRRAVDDARRPDARLRMGRRSRQRVAAGRPGTACRSPPSRRPSASWISGHVVAPGTAHARADAVPALEWRAGLRRRDDPVGLGTRHPPRHRPGQRTGDARRQHAAGHDQRPRATWARSPRRCRPACFRRRRARTSPRPHRRSCRPPTARAFAAESVVTITRHRRRQRRRCGRRAWRSRSTAAPRGIAPRDARAGAGPWRPA